MQEASRPRRSSGLSHDLNELRIEVAELRPDSLQREAKGSWK
jgi:hypothetical protein